MMNPFIPYTQPGDYRIQTDLYRVHRTGELIEKVDPESIGPMTITCNENIATKRTATIVTDNPEAYRPFLDHLMPFLTIVDPEGNSVSGPQGLYMVMPSNSTTASDGRSGSIECRDLTQLFAMDSSSGYMIPAGTDRGAAIRTWVSDYGLSIDQVQIPDFGVIQPEDRVWEAGTFLQEAMSEAASGSNWYAPWFDNRGQLVTAVYKPLTDVAPTWVYTNANEDDAADIEGVIVEKPDWNRLANKVIVRKVGDQENPSVSYTAINDNPESPASHTNLGAWITKVIDNNDLVDEEAAKVQAEQILSESASHYRKLTLPSFPVVDADLHQTVGLEIVLGGQIVYTGKFWRTGYTLTLDGGNTTFSQNLARVEEWR